MKKDEIARIALLESIEHWQRMRNDPTCGERSTSDQCSLCVQFMVGAPGSEKCGGCPISEYTGKTMCYDTPYNTARSAWEDWMDAGRPLTGLLFEAWQDAAQCEIDFLEGLK